MKKGLFYIAISSLMLITWEHYAKDNSRVRLLVSSPSLIVEYFRENIENLSIAGAVTLLESVLGLIVATGFSFITMILCILFPKFLEFVLPIFISSQVIPIIAFAPLLIMVFGFGLNVKIVMAALMCFFPLFMNFFSGIKSIHSTVRELTFIYDASNWFKIFRISFPLSLPNIFTGLKISSTLSVIGAIVAEFSGAECGLGKNLFLSAKRVEPELMMTSLTISIILGGIMYSTVLFIERRLGKWYLNT